MLRHIAYSVVPPPAIGIKALALLFTGSRFDPELGGACFYIFGHVKILIIQHNLSQYIV